MKIIIACCRWLNEEALKIAGVFLAAMILLSCGNIFLRLVWMPIKGTYELLGFFSALVAGLAVGYAQLKHAHTAVDILTSRYPKGIRKTVTAIKYIICCIFFTTGGWQVCVWASTLRASGEVTETLRIPYYPFTFILGIGFFLLALAAFAQFLTMFSIPNRER
jgi:TRAP-type C4-dicarboxylate transport system permease small subunit